MQGVSRHRIRAAHSCRAEGADFDGSCPESGADVNAITLTICPDVNEVRPESATSHPGRNHGQSKVGPLRVKLTRNGDVVDLKSSAGLLSQGVGIRIISPTLIQSVKSSMRLIAKAAPFQFPQE